MPTLHEFALREAERVNPGGWHLVTGVEIDGDPTEPGEVTINVHTCIPPRLDTARVKITNVKIDGIPGLS